jgi:hypothetical protein
MADEYLIYCDESDASGRHYGNFYGGVLLKMSDFEEIVKRLNAVKLTNNLHNEIKWQRITEQYLDKYLAVVDEVFKLLKEGKLKIRIMFTQNYNSPARLTADERELGFFMLYYQFIKHAFGLKFAGNGKQLTGIRIYFDRLPDTVEKVASFKGFVLGLNSNNEFSKARVQIRHDQLAEVDSKDHVVLQALDVVLGAMQFRLNDKHKDKPENARVRGKRTIAKEKVYKKINSLIRELYDGKQFNVGISTGQKQGRQSLWADPYRHWRFVSKNAILKPEFVKNKKIVPR